MINLSIVDDDPDFLYRIGAILKGESDFAVNGIYDSPSRLLAELPTLTLDVLLVDIMMPEINGVELIGQIKSLYSGFKIAALSSHNEGDTILTAIRAGAAGYISKQDTSTQICEGIRTLVRQGAFISPFSSCYLMGRLRNMNRSTGPSLSSVERFIINALKEGMTYKEIAERRNVSLFTVQNQVHGLYKKLHVNRKSEAVQKAVDLDLFRG